MTMKISNNMGSFIFFETSYNLHKEDLVFPGIVPFLHNMNVMYVIIEQIKYGFAVLNVTYRFSYNDQIIIRIVNMWDLHSGRQMHNNFNNFLNIHIAMLFQ